MTPISRRLADRVIPLEPLAAGLEPSGALPEKPAALLFDVYGTLLISAAGDIPAGRNPEARPGALAELLDQYTVCGTPADICRALKDEIAAVHDRMKKQGFAYPEVKIDRVWQTVLKTADRELARQFAAEFEMIVNPVYPMPGAAALLSAIREKRVPAGLVSNAQFYTEHMLKLFFGDFPQDSWADPKLIFYSFEHGHAKPSPHLFELAAAALAEKGIAAGSALYVGNDMLKDICPAAESGFKTALFAGDARSLRLREEEPRYRGKKPDLVVTALEQLKQYV